MGFRPALKQFELVFSAEKYKGLEVTVRSASTGMYLDLLPAIDAFEQGRVTLGQAAELIKQLGEHLVSWNIEDPSGGEEPLPANSDGVRKLDLDMTVDVLKAWFEGMVAVPDPLDEPSTSGETSEVASLPMDPL